MKVNIKMRVTPEQSKQVQEICFKVGIKWGLHQDTIKHENKPYLFINPITIKWSDCEEDFQEDEFKEVNADLFISTNGTCNINDIKYINWKLKGTDEKPLRMPITKEQEELNKQIDNLCLKNSFWDKEKIEYNTDEAPKYYGEVNLELSNNATNPNHYTKMKIAPNEYITANYECFSWNTANVIKYTSRYKSKNGIEDLEKAIKYLQFEIEELRKNQEIQDCISRC